MSSTRFIPSMECLPVSKLPEGELWTYEIKLDGYRLEVVRSGGKTTLYSRRENVLNSKFPAIAAALNSLPDGTILDGELVALDEVGRPNFNLLQNFRSSATQIHFYAFDILRLRNKDLTQRPLSERREILRSVLKPEGPIDLSGTSASAYPMLQFVKKVGLEGVIAKRVDSLYEPGKRTGLWSKYRLSLDQEFVIGGYVPSHLGLDSIVIGFYQGDDLYYAARVRAGFVPAARKQVFQHIRHLERKRCPFVNLPEKEAGRWGQGLTEEKMKQCVWLRPEAVARVSFLEWTGANHLRHTKFMALREDKDPRKVVRET